MSTETIITRTVADMANDLSMIALDVKWAAARVAVGAEYDLDAVLAQGLAELRRARVALGRLIDEIEGEAR